MRTATVKVAFTDKIEGILREPGDVFEASDERAEELESGGWVTLAPQKKATKNTTKKKD